MKRIVIGCIVAAALAVAPTVSAQQQVPLPGSDIPQFVDPLPGLVIADGTGPLTLTMCEFKANVLPTGTFAPGVAPETWTWGYVVGTTCPTTTQSTYLGPVIIAERGTPTEMTFINNLGDTATTNVLAYKNATDQTLHWADPLNKEENACSEAAMMNPSGTAPQGLCAENYDGPIPAVVHLHGGEVPPQLDGGPDAWFTSDGMYQGHGYYSFPGTGYDNSSVYVYPNSQEAAVIWFHDHTLGATRLNVYAGLAGGYVLTDPADASVPSNLPPIVPLIIQDRSFDKNGQLFFPAGAAYVPNPDHPYWVPELVADTVAVNGKVWPYFEVEPKRYRFLFLNGSNARTYEMILTNQVTKVNGPVMWQIGTDGGYLDHPVLIDPNAPKGQLSKLVIMPGERADVIIDFAGLPVGTQLLLRNGAKAPYPAGETPNGRTVGRVMQFRVVQGSGAADGTFDPAVPGATLRAPMVRLADPATGTLATGVVAQVTRQLTLNEVMGAPTVVNGIPYPGGPLEILVNNTTWNGTLPDGSVRSDFTPVTVNGITTGYSELPDEGETEIWEIVNITADAHPIHLHLVQFQIINRQRFDARKYNAAYAAAYGGVVVDGYGPPNDYNVPNGDGAVGGNPAVGPYLRGAAMPPAANEAGWKDTIITFPGEVTRIAVRWAPTDLPATTAAADAYYPFEPNGGHGYVWHCHIIDHEDNEMMRPNLVIPNDAAIRDFEKGIDY